MFGASGVDRLVALRADFAPTRPSLQGRCAPFPSPCGLRFRSAAKPALPALVQPTDPHKEGHMNAVQIVARLTTAPTVEERGGTQVGRLRLAVQRQRGKDGEDRGADFIDVTVFGRQAETCAKYLAKGRRVAVEGHLHHSEWEAEDGSRRQKLEVIARSVEFLGAPRAEQSEPEPAAAAAAA
jgi:single-strand DNA-binding protein